MSRRRSLLRALAAYKDMSMSTSRAVDAQYLVVFVLLDQESWSFGQEQQTNTDDDRPGELHSNRDAVRPAIVTALSCIVNDRSQKQALSTRQRSGGTSCRSDATHDSNSKLISTNDSCRGGYQHLRPY